MIARLAFVLLYLATGTVLPIIGFFVAIFGEALRSGPLCVFEQPCGEGAVDPTFGLAAMLLGITLAILGVGAIIKLIRLLR